MGATSNQAHNVYPRRTIVFLATHEQCHQRLLTQLPAPVAVHLGIKGSTRWQRIGRIKMVARAKNPARTVLQTDLHLAAQNKNPLVVPRAMELASKSRWTVTQLIAP